VDAVDHAVGDGLNTVQTGVGQQVAQGKVVVPASTLIRGAVDSSKLAVECFLGWLEPHPVYAVTAQIVHHQNRTGLLVHLVSNTIGLATSH